MPDLRVEVWVPEVPGAEGGTCDTFRVPISVDHLHGEIELQARSLLKQLSTAAELLKEGGTGVVRSQMDTDPRSLAWQLVQCFDAQDAISRWVSTEARDA